MSSSFEVSEVERGSTRFDTIPAHEAIHRRVSVGREVFDRAAKQRRIEYPPMLGYEPTDAADVVPVLMHPFVGAVQLAFDAHLPLRLSPDHVWVVLAQGFANHISLNREALRHRFVAHEGKLTLQVRRDDFVLGRPNPWPEVFEAFCAEIREHVGKPSDLVIADFSTTGPLERAVSQLVLMDAMQGYFKYAIHTACGIPRITLTGTPADWRSIRARAEVFAEYGLSGWVVRLRPILDAFVDAAEGRVDIEHWRSMYKLRSASGGRYVSGWLPLLFPYLVRGAGKQLNPNPFLQGWKQRFDSPDALFSGPKTDEFPTALASAPMRWNYLNGTLDMQLIGGFAGVRQDPDTLEVSPQLAWAVRCVG